MPYVLAGVNDFIFGAKIRETAKGVSVTLRCVGNLAAFVQALEAEQPALVLVDLSDRTCPGLEMLQALKGRDLPSVGFYSHVDEKTRLDALAAGCSEVMARSHFVQVLPRLLSSAATK